MTSIQISFVKLHRHTLLALCSAAFVAACGGGGDSSEHGNGHHKIDTAGRLALAENGAATVRIFDLDSMGVTASHTLDHSPSSLYTSPGGRYVVAMQRMQDQVQFIDGGIWQEDHGDHLHDYKTASALVPWTLTGSRPTHYDLQPGKQAAFFMDGNSAATPVQNAGVRLITENSIAAKRIEASVDLAYPIHGLGEPVGNKLLTVSRAEDATTTLPTHLELYQRSGSGYTYDRRLETRCEGMHGSISSGAHTAVGCMDGVMLVTHTSATGVSDRKVSTPLRVGAIAGHPKLVGQFIAIATEGSAAAPPVTTRFYAINAEAGTSAELSVPGWGSASVRRAHAIDRSGRRFAVLDHTGSLRMTVRDGSTWAAGPVVNNVVPVMPAAAPWPTIVANGAKDVLYITDPVARQLVTVNSQTGAVVSRTALGFMPSSITWVGIGK